MNRALVRPGPGPSDACFDERDARMTENRLDKGPETLRDIRCPCGALLSRAARGEWRVAETAPSA